MKNLFIIFIPIFFLFLCILFLMRMRKMGLRKALFSSIAASGILGIMTAGCAYCVIYFSAPRNSAVIDTLYLAPFIIGENPVYGFGRQENLGSPEISEYYLFSNDNGKPCILKYRNTELKEIITNTHGTACLERCRSHFTGWAAIFTGRADEDFLRLHIPEGGLATESKNQRFIIVPN